MCTYIQYAHIHTSILSHTYIHTYVRTYIVYVYMCTAESAILFQSVDRSRFRNGDGLRERWLSSVHVSVLLDTFLVPKDGCFKSSTNGVLMGFNGI